MASGNQFIDEALQAHNNYRARHGCPPLEHDANLTAFAQEWANKLAHFDRFEHRQNNQYGENLYTMWSSNPNAQVGGKDAVDDWYSEIRMYRFGAEPMGGGTGHFTQVVWKGSQKMGIAQARSRSGKVIVVANYEPAGNFVGQYRMNVPPPQR